jgi:hypothetical protein
MDKEHYSGQIGQKAPKSVQTLAIFCIFSFVVSGKMIIFAT